MAITPFKWQFFDFDKTTGLPKAGTNFKITKDGGATFLPSASGVNTDANGSAVISVSVAGAYDVYIDGSPSADNQGVTIIPMEANKIKGYDTDGIFESDVVSDTGLFKAGDVWFGKSSGTGYAMMLSGGNEARIGGSTIMFVNYSYVNNDVAKTPTTWSWHDGTVSGYAEHTFGTIKPGIDNTYDIGTGGKRVREIFAANAVINTSDETTKCEIGNVPQELIDALKPLKPKIYKIKESVEKKGAENARWHVGYIAQDVEKCLIDAKLDPFKYSFLCKDEIFEEKINKKTGEIKKVSKGYRYGLRYSELEVLMKLV